MNNTLRGRNYSLSNVHTMKEIHSLRNRYSFVIFISVIFILIFQFSREINLQDKNINNQQKIMSYVLIVKFNNRLIVTNIKLTNYSDYA